MSTWEGETFANWHPRDVRRLIRAGQLQGRPTSGMCSGYSQANVIIVPSSMADDFERFCSLNPGAFPLLYRSKPGELAAPPLAEESDIRTDGMYRVCKDGKLLPEPCTLLQYTEEMKDMVTFYTGCSFSFEGALLAEGVPVRNVEQRLDVGIFRTNIRCRTFKRFDCEVVVSMRYMPEDKLETAVRVTHWTPISHGAPIHIGDPGVIGISDLENVDWGDVVRPTPGDVPVFWPCGVTMEPAIVSACPSLAFFTHGTKGVLFLCDTKTRFVKDTNMADTPSVVRISQNPLLYSVASEKAVSCVNELERHILPQQAQPDDLYDNGTLLKSALALSHASSVAILTVPSPKHDESGSQERYGELLGAVAITAMLQALGKEVTIVDIRNYNSGKLAFSILEELERVGYLQEASAAPVLFFPGENTPDTDKITTLHRIVDENDHTKLKYDHLVRIGATAWTGDSTNALDRLLNVKLPRLKTTAIGAHGSGADISTDYTIQAGVPIWGGWALAMALYVLNACPIHDRYTRRSVGSARDMKYCEKATISLERELLALSVVLKQAYGDQDVSKLQFSSKQRGVITALRNLAGLM